MTNLESKVLKFFFENKAARTTFSVRNNDKRDPIYGDLPPSIFEAPSLCLEDKDELEKILVKFSQSKVIIRDKGRRKEHEAFYHDNTADPFRIFKITEKGERVYLIESGKEPNNSEPLFKPKQEVKVSLEKWQKLKKEFSRQKSYKDKLIFWEQNNLFNLSNPFQIFNPACADDEAFKNENYISIYPGDGIEVTSHFNDPKNLLKASSKSYLFVEQLIDHHGIIFKNFINDFNKIVDKSPNPVKTIETEIERLQNCINTIEGTKIGYDLSIKKGLRIEDVPKGWLLFHIESPFLTVNFNTLCDGFELAKFELMLNEKLEKLRNKKTQSFEKIERQNKGNKTTLKELALISFYTQKQITRENGNQIAKQHGHNSGEKLFQLYTKYSTRANRIAKEDSRKKNLNKIQLFEKIISRLNKKEKEKAIDEMNTLKAAIEKT